MPARFETLRDDGIHTVRFQPPRFVDRRRRREYLRAPRLAPAPAAAARASRNESSRPRAGTRSTTSAASALNGTRPGSGRNGVLVDAKLRVVRRKRRPPRRFALGAGRGRRVAEEVHVERPVGLRPDRRELAAHGVERQAARTGASPARPHWTPPRPARCPARPPSAPG